MNEFSPVVEDIEFDVHGAPRAAHRRVIDQARKDDVRTTLNFGKSTKHTVFAGIIERFVLAV